MSWFNGMFGEGPDKSPGGMAKKGSCADLEEAVAAAKRMLATLLEAYGEESVIVRQQCSYLETLTRELSACRAA